MSILLICQSKLKNIEDISYVPQIQETFHSYLLRSLSGQQLDLKNEPVNEEDYIYMNFLKSGSLIALACFLGTGNMIDNKETKSRIKTYSNYLGLIFQLRNDVADMKSGFLKSDLIYKKKTLPILYYLNTADEKYKNIQDYYLNIHSQIKLSIVHKDLLNDNTALLYCSIVENIFIRKYQDTVMKLSLPEKDETKLISIISF